MIDLKRNSKKELVTAKGIRSRESSIYVPNQENDFKVSRSKFHDFLTCKRCFYLDRVKGLDAPGTPGWTLNETTDLLLKKEFDICRKNQIPHEIFKKNNIEEIIAVDKKLDPNLHQAMMEVEDKNKEPGTIVQEIQKGYKMKDRLLRPSLVAVSKKPQKNEEKSEEKAKK